MVPTGGATCALFVMFLILFVAWFLGAVIVYHVSEPRVRLVAATDTLDYCLSGDVTQER